MIDRINLILKAKNVTARQFAEEIGIQPSGMSHILSGRNNPSLDFVMKVIRRYPEIDINWLMFGKGEMYDSQHSHPQPEEPVAKSVSPRSEPSVPKDPVFTQAAPISPAHANFVTQEPDLFSVSEVSMPNAAAPVPSSVAPVSGSTAPDPASVTSAPEAVASSNVSMSSGIKPSSVSDPASMPASSSTSTPVSNSSMVEKEKEQKVYPNENRINEYRKTADFIQPSHTEKRVVRVIFCYDDHTFSEFVPE